MLLDHPNIDGGSMLFLPSVLPKYGWSESAEDSGHMQHHSLQHLRGKVSGDRQAWKSQCEG